MPTHILLNPPSTLTAILHFRCLSHDDDWKSSHKKKLGAADEVPFMEAIFKKLKEQMNYAMGTLAHTHTHTNTRTYTRTFAHTPHMLQTP